MIAAYLNHHRRLVRTLEPDLPAYGIEANAAYTPKTPDSPSSWPSAARSTPR
ncbi:hypothetical protein [Oceanithermus profundus]|uniref:hypothetical protein n=1 Tax=Oceanithermus profundus TaxID=187137 RepID=UPI00030533CA|nr:hypothetical protein [Oceanithermus profundus]